MVERNGSSEAGFVSVEDLGMEIASDRAFDRKHFSTRR
jgi:hypothetical protein